MCRTAGADTPCRRRAGGGHAGDGATAAGKQWGTGGMPVQSVDPKLASLRMNTPYIRQRAVFPIWMNWLTSSTSTASSKVGQATCRLLAASWARFDHGESIIFVAHVNAAPTGCAAVSELVIHRAGAGIRAQRPLRCSARSQDGCRLRPAGCSRTLRMVSGCSAGFTERGGGERAGTNAVCRPRLDPGRPVPRLPPAARGAVINGLVRASINTGWALHHGGWIGRAPKFLQQMTS